MNKRTVGAETEERAVRFLQEQGYCPVMQNYRCRLGEIDIIAEEDGALVFLEVKYRRTTAYGLPEQAVDARKQMKIRKIAMWYAAQNRIPADRPMRFDVVAMDEREIRLYKNAF
ncbi:MAG: YraN family protein [Lachnospiraceae bacterium]|nr:YraN family protein [Lachnospiraceae bacterium]